MRRIGGQFLFISIAIFLLIYVFYAQQNEGKTLAYSELLTNAKEGNIKEIVWSYPEARGVYKTKDSNGKEIESNFKAYLPNPEDLNLFKILEDKNVKITAEASKSNIWVIILNLLPIVFIIIIAVMMYQQMNSPNGGGGGGGFGAFSFGRSRHKLSDSRKKVTFADVAGVEEAKEELREIVDFLKHSAKYKRIGARIPKGVLLLGSPGTGKTLLGRAVAGEAGVPFFFISGSDFVEMFVGVGASRVRDLFDQAKKSAPSIVFIDEIDAVGRQRGAGYGGGHDEREQTLNQLLVEMDGFEVNNGVIILAATNRADVLDPALLRPGRFDRHIVVDRPDVNGRKAILKVHAKNKMIDKSVDLDVLAKRTPGFSGADLENLINEAALLTARKNKKTIKMPQCEEAIERVIMGPERKSRVLSEKEKKTIAYHETGHAIAGYVTPGADPVRKITILPRGMALGVTWSMPEDDKHLQTTEELFAQIVVLLGGRVAEEIVFGDVTTGASNDLERATDLARKMVMKYGMSEKVGLITYGKDDENVFLGRDIMKRHYCSEKTSETIDAEVKRSVDEAYARTKETLLSYTERMDFVVNRLLECEVMEGDELKEIMEAKDLDELREKYKVESENKKKVEEESEKEDDSEDEDEEQDESDNDSNVYPDNNPFDFLARKVHLVDRNKNTEEDEKKEKDWWLQKKQNENIRDDPYLPTVQEGINRVYHILISVEFGIEEEFDKNKDYEKLFLHYKSNIDNSKDTNHLIDNIKHKKEKQDDE